MPDPRPRPPRGLTVLAVLAFGALAGIVSAGAGSGLDAGVVRWLAARRTPWLAEAAGHVTVLGNSLTLVVIALVLGLVLVGLERRGEVALLVVATVGTLVLNPLLKELFDRARPDVAAAVLHAPTGHAFPSGHAMNSAAVYTAIALAVLALDPPAAVRNAVVGTCLVVAVMVALSRVVLGVHYPSDVLAGAAAGWAWAAAADGLVRRHLPGADA